MSNREVVVVSGVRTAIGDYGGSLKEMPATKLGATAIREAVARAKVDPASVGHVVMGSVIHGEAKDMYLARVAAVEGEVKPGRIYEIGGPQTLTHREIVERVLRETGRNNPLIPVPRGIGKLLALPFALLPFAPLLTGDQVGASSSSHALRPSPTSNWS